MLDGFVTLDGAIVPTAWLEVLAELLCKHGKIVPLDPEPKDDQLVEPDDV